MEGVTCGSRSLVSAEASGQRKHSSSKDHHGVALHIQDRSPHFHISLAE